MDYEKRAYMCKVYMLFQLFDSMAQKQSLCKHNLLLWVCVKCLQLTQETPTVYLSKLQEQPS